MTAALLAMPSCCAGMQIAWSGWGEADAHGRLRRPVPRWHGYNLILDCHPIGGQAHGATRRAEQSVLTWRRVRPPAFRPPVDTPTLLRREQGVIERSRLAPAKSTLVLHPCRIVRHPFSGAHAVRHSRP